MYIGPTMLVLLLLLSCVPAKVQVADSTAVDETDADTDADADGDADGDADTDIEDTAPDLPPQDLAFESVIGGRGGPAFSVDGEAYFIYGGTIAHVLDPRKGTDEQIVDTSPTGLNCVHSYTVEVLGHKVYVMGGQYGPDPNCDVPDGASNAVWEIDLDARTWKKAASMAGAREVLQSGVVDGQIWVLGGWQPVDNVNGLNNHTVEVFNGTSWSTVSTSGAWQPVRSAAYATAGSRIYLFGGCVEGQMTGIVCPCASTVVQIFDTATRTFSQGSPMPFVGRHFSGQHAITRGDSIYLFGGASDFSCCTYDDVARYDTTSDTWTLLTDRLTAPRKSVGAVIHEDELLVYGGIRALDGQCTDKGACDETCEATGVGTNEIGTFVTP